MSRKLRDPPWNINAYREGSKKRGKTQIILLPALPARTSRTLLPSKQVFPNRSSCQSGVGQKTETPPRSEDDHGVVWFRDPPFHRRLITVIWSFWFIMTYSFCNAATLLTLLSAWDQWIIENICQEDSPRSDQLFPPSFNVSPPGLLLILVRDVATPFPI